MQQRATTKDNIAVYSAYDEIVKIENLKPNPKNPNQHPAEQIALLADIITRTGWRNTITVSTLTGYIVKGHGRLLAAEYAGFTEVPVEYQHYNTEADELADLVADNRLAELAEMDKARLAEIFATLDTEKLKLTGYTEQEAQDLQDIMADIDLAADIAEDLVPAAEIDAEPVTRPGDIWLLGKNKLICGDATDEAVYKALMGDELAQLIITDPPYNVDYTGKTEKALKIKNDNKKSNEFKQLLIEAFTNMGQYGAPGAAVYIWHAPTEGLNFRLAMAAAGIEEKQELIWAKNHFVLGRQDYQWQHEPCLYGWIKGGAHYFIDDHKQSTIQALADVDLEKLKKHELIELINNHLGDALPSSVIREKRPMRADLHPTMKPIKLFNRLMTNSSKRGWLVLDPFAGSGTTLITAEMAGRVARCIELDPYYCDVIVRRYINTFEDNNVKCLRSGKLAAVEDIEKIFQTESG
jgi:DNA modification methylase